MTAQIPPHVVEDPFPGGVQPNAQPERMGAIAILAGMDVASPKRCRVLELACGEGVNLLSAAIVYPQSQFVGVDVAPRAVETARRDAGALRLANVRFVQAEFGAVPADLGEFDFVTAPGVYSWVPAPARDRLLALISRHLAPNGVAHLSYNAMPGAGIVGVVRAMMLRHARGAADAPELGRRGIELVEFLASAPPGSGPSFPHLRAEYERIRTTTPVGLAHDDLAPAYEAFFLGDVVEHARRHGLAYLGDGTPQMTAEHDLPDHARARLDAFAKDPVQRAEYVDMIRLRRFRHTLLRRRESLPTDRPLVDSMSRLHLGPGIRVGESVVLPSQGAAAPETTADEELDAADVRLVGEAMALLEETWPHRRSFGEIVMGALSRAGQQGRPSGEAAATLAEALFDAYEIGLLNVHLDPADCARSAAVRPVASPLARLQARSRDMVASLFQENARLHHASIRTVLCLLDGTRDRTAILDALRLPEPPVAEIGPLDVPVDAKVLETMLQGFASAGLLLA